MKKQHFFLILVFAIAAIAFSSRPFYASTWAGTASNEMVTRAALKNAVDNGIFTANTTIPNDLRLVTREMAQSYVNIQAITGRSMNQLVPKSLFTAATVYYTHEGYFLCFSDTYTTGTGYTSSANALGYSEPWYTVNFKTLYNRPLQVGDQVFKVDDITKPAVVDDAVPCSTTGGYWFYYPALNAAIQVTATNTASQYVLDIVYPSGTTNVNICLIVDIAGNTATVQAQASTAVNTNVAVNWTYDINGGGAQLGSTFTINNGNTTSSVQNINNGSTINTMVVAISDFFPTSNGSQNYISGGQCN